MQGFLLAVVLAAASSPADTSAATAPPAAAPAANAAPAPAPINREEARRAFKEGDEAFKAGSYDVALKDFLKSYELSHLGELLYDIAQCYRLLSRWTEAQTYYQRYLTEFPNGKSRDLATTQLVEVKQKLAELEAARPVPTDLRAVPPPEPTGQVTASSAKESHPSAVAIGLGTVGVVASVVAVVGLVEALSFSHPSTPQPVSQVQASVDSANTWATVALISGIVGVAGITGGILTW